MATPKYKCPKHNARLRAVEDYPGILRHTGCSEIFTVIDGALCFLEGKFGESKWLDTKTRTEPATRNHQVEDHKKL